MGKLKKRVLSLMLCVCLCAAMCCFVPLRASADNEITKVLSTAVPVPVALMDVSNVASGTSTQGCYIAAYNWYDANGAVASGTFGTGAYTVVIQIDTCDGYVFSPNVAVYLNNSHVDFTLDSSMRSLTLSRTYVPDIWKPTIYKHPGNETTDAGGDASFVVSSDYTSSYTWEMSPPDDDSVSYDVIKMREMFPGLKTEPQGRNKMNLYNIPAELDGWRIRCIFEYPHGGIKSNYATLTVRHEEVPEESAPPEEAPVSVPLEEAPESAPPEETPLPSAPAEEPADSEQSGHTHAFGSLWHSDESFHWRECECGETGEKGEHSMVWTVFSAPTRHSPGKERGICAVCSYTQEREVEYEPTIDDVLGYAKYALYGTGILIVVIVLLMIITAIRESAERRRRRKRRRRY